jgi:hypothetical protein
MASFRLTYLWGFRNISESVEESVPTRHYRRVSVLMKEAIEVLRSVFPKDSTS